MKYAEYLMLYTNYGNIRKVNNISNIGIVENRSYIRQVT